jgi:DNA-binding LacI/PurR family transcriptional regulator
VFFRGSSFRVLPWPVLLRGSVRRASVAQNWKRIPSCVVRAKFTWWPGPYAVAPSEPEAARHAAAGLFRKHPNVTAVIAANFWLTIGTLRAVPEDVVVVGFDDLFLADLLRRPITTVVQPVGELGRRAVRLLLENISNPGADRQVVLQPRLVIGAGQL